MLKNLNSSILFSRKKPAASAKDVIAWWESRRVSYNLLVGAAGIFSCMIVAVDVAATRYLWRAEGGLPDPPIFLLFGILGYGIAANLCFTVGWLAELVIRSLWAAESDRLAVLSFKIGLVFSVFLTLIPAFIFGAFGIIGLWPHIFGNGQH